MGQTPRFGIEEVGGNTTPDHSDKLPIPGQIVGMVPCNQLQPVHPRFYVLTVIVTPHGQDSEGILALVPLLEVLNVGVGAGPGLKIQGLNEGIVNPGHIEDDQAPRSLRAKPAWRSFPSGPKNQRQSGPGQEGHDEETLDNKPLGPGEGFRFPGTDLCVGDGNPELGEDSGRRQSRPQQENETDPRQKPPDPPVLRLFLFTR